MKVCKKYSERVIIHLVKEKPNIESFLAKKIWNSVTNMPSYNKGLHTILLKIYDAKCHQLFSQIVTL